MKLLHDTHTHTNSIGKTSMCHQNTLKHEWMLFQTIYCIWHEIQHDWAEFKLELDVNSFSSTDSGVYDFISFDTNYDLKQATFATFYNKFPTISTKIELQIYHSWLIKTSLNIWFFILCHT